VAEIEATRAELADTINSIAERVSPQRLGAIVKAQASRPQVIAASATAVVLVAFLVRRRRRR
jgi:MYXO-CTERM domain-containing protein